MKQEEITKARVDFYREFEHQLSLIDQLKITSPSHRFRLNIEIAGSAGKCRAIDELLTKNLK